MILEICRNSSVEGDYHVSGGGEINFTWSRKKNKTLNIKRKAILMFMYSEGLKVGEVVWLQPEIVSPLDTVLKEKEA